MNTKLYQRIISKVFPIDRTRLLIDLIILSLLGALAVILRAKLRIPLNMPGHHGLEVMAILLIGRQISKIPVASSISALSAALFISFPFLGFKDPFLPVIYVFIGICVDLIYYLFINNKFKFLIIAIIGGLGYMIIPISRILIFSALNYNYSSFIKHGFFIPVISHFLFGFLGGLLAYSLFYFTKKQLNRKEQ